MSADKIFPNFAYRLDVMNDINKILRESNSDIINGYDMESQFAAKARNEEEYMSFVARFIHEVRNGDPVTVLDGATQCIRARADEQSAPISNQNMSGGTMILLGNFKFENEGRDLCCICLDKSVNTVLIPYGHLTLCYGCDQKQSNEQQNRWMK